MRCALGGPPDHPGSVLTVSLCRPDIRNAQLPATWEALARIGDAVPDSVRVVVISGDGPSFSAGLDRSAFSGDGLLGQVATAPGAVGDALIAGYQRGFTWQADPRFVSIAAVRGHAVGAGFQLALACDLMLIADDARFRMAEVRYGLVPDLGGTHQLVRRIGAARALEVCGTGREVTAAEALSWGLAVRSVPADDLGDATDQLVAGFLAAPPEALRSISSLVAGAGSATVEQQLRAERVAQLSRLRDLLRGGISGPPGGPAGDSPPGPPGGPATG
ncbi:enoyl-CoA hydratase/isomerase family protein [Nakamurella sp. YIM 132087]|uniref:Enoyl-CoA hydratase/isomerase family protein n=1 Tax=Nakamurella alba TaxID=2665158 RepID=A0A7K1FI86_9ACTN|nr:enoyl-CoA hydratase/isomerase family protein [Nakamurella alba]